MQISSRDDQWEEFVDLYDFEVLRSEEVIAAERSVPLYSPKAAWPKIIKLAKSVDMPGCRIRVKEQSGETIILVGVAAALRYSDLDFHQPDYSFPSS